MKGNILNKPVAALKATIEQEPILRMYLEMGLQSIPTGGVLYGASLNKVFHLLSNLCITPPKFEDDQIAGVPFLSLFFDLIDTKGGQCFFSSKIVNQHLKEIFDDYNVMLCSKGSLKYMNED